MTSFFVRMLFTSAALAVIAILLASEDAFPEIILRYIFLASMSVAVVSGIGIIWTV